jgi:hypothetical protein
VTDTADPADLVDRLKTFLADLPSFERERVEKRIKAGHRVVAITEEDGMTVIEWAKPGG